MIFDSYIAAHFEKARLNLAQTQYEARCPVHGDDRPSLLIDRNTGKMGCQACGYSAWLDEHAKEYGLPAPPLKPEQEAFERKKEQKTSTFKKPAGKPRSRIVAEYVYRKADGSNHLRILKTEDKQFYQHHWDGSSWQRGITTKTGQKIDCLPYNLPKILGSDDDILWVEGEKDCDRAAALGYLATTTPGGAEKAGKCSDWTAFEGRTVTILPDNDAKGEEYADEVGRRLLAVGANVLICKLDGLPEKGDLSDWLDLGYNAKHLEAALLRSEPFEVPVESLPKPRIVITDTDPVKVFEQVFHALTIWGDLFVRGGEIVQFYPRDTGPAKLVPLNRDDLLCLIAERAQIVQVMSKKTGEREELIFPPGWIAKMVEASTWRFEQVKRVTELPFVDSDGVLVTQEGLSKDGVYLAPLFPGLKLTGSVSKAEAYESACWLRDELFCDFPFIEEYHKVHTVGAMITPILADFIRSPNPLQLISATKEGTGKTLLANLIQYIVCLESTAEITENPNPKDFRETIFSELRNAPTSFLIDNIQSSMAHDWFQGLVTSRGTNYRVLGESKTIVVSPPPLWLLTANNPEFNRETLRRCVPIRLQAKAEIAWKRTDFKRPKIWDYVRANHAEILDHIYRIVRFWIAQGRPTGERSLGTFERWSDAVGGCLSVCGLDGFLQNLEDESEILDLRTHQLRELFVLWKDLKGAQWLTAKSVANFALAHDLFNGILADKQPGGQARSMGKLLSSERDNSYGGWTLIRKVHRGNYLYSVKCENQAHSEKVVDLEFPIVPSPPHIHHGTDGVTTGQGVLEGCGGCDSYAHTRTREDSSTVAHPPHPPNATNGEDTRINRGGLVVDEGLRGNAKHQEFPYGEKDLSERDKMAIERALLQRSIRKKSSFFGSRAFQWPEEVQLLIDQGRWRPPEVAAPPPVASGPTKAPQPPPEEPDELADGLNGFFGI